MSQTMKKTIGHRGINPTGETTYKKVGNQLALTDALKAANNYFYLNVFFPIYC